MIMNSENATEIEKMYQQGESYYMGERPEMLKYISSNVKKVLDVGCAAGNFGQSIKKAFNCEVWGIDISSEFIQHAQRKIDKALLGSISENLSQLPDSYFDAIYFNDVLEHLVDPYSTLVMLKRKLASGGVMITSIPNVRHFRTLISLVMKRDWKYEDSGILDRTHLRFFTEKSIRRMFQELDFHIIEMNGINKTKSRKPFILNIITLGFFGLDTRYLQFVSVVKPKV